VAGAAGGSRHAGGRIGFGPVDAGDVRAVRRRLPPGQSGHPLALGLVEQIPYLAKQSRLTFARAGVTDPLSLADYEAHDGYKGLRNALAMEPAEIVAAVTASGLRGRGGAAFPTGIKWNTVLKAPARQKYIVCNADEGDSGTFADRIVMEGDPFMLIEGMTIAGLAVGATRGYIYVRSEYPHCDRQPGITPSPAPARPASSAPNMLGSGRTFELEVRKGAGAYICGEETALLESIEGKRGVVRAKPPLPALSGLFGKPTVINNVLSLAAVPLILDKGAASTTRTTAWAVRAAPCRCSWPGTSSRAA
jgi:formate dehydrogenase iron-sulfur subunit